jgi:hypothetical protein
VLRGLIGDAGSGLLDDLAEGGVDVFGHTGGVAADVQTGPFFKPGPERGGGFEHALLDVHLGLAIAGPGEIDCASRLMREKGWGSRKLSGVGVGARARFGGGLTLGEGIARRRRGVEGRRERFFLARAARRGGWAQPILGWWRARGRVPRVSPRGRGPTPG